MSSSLLPKKHAAKEIKKTTSFIKSTLKSAKRTKVIVAASGGIDSSTTMALAARAVGPTEVVVLTLPYNKTYPQGIKNAQAMAKFLKIPKRNVYKTDIGPSVERIWKAILINLSRSQTGLTKLANQIRFGNIMARVRMVFIYDMAKSRNALVCGTENRSEHLLGYYTRYGDEASDLEPLRHLYKTQVRQLAEHLKFPEEILTQKPSAGLWAEQTDREELGFSYKQGDQVLYLHFDKKMSPTKIAKKLHSNTREKTETYWKRRVKKVLERAGDHDFKHHLPYHL